MKERAIELKVGILVLVALGLLGALIFALGNFSLAKGAELYVDFTFIGNLHEGAPVKVAGIKVGKVRRVRFLGGKLDKRSGRRVYVRLQVWLERRALSAVHNDAEFFINTQGVLGEQYLEIVPGSATRPSVKAGDILLGMAPPRADLIVSRLYEFLDGVTRLLRKDKDTISNLLRASSKAVKTIDTLLVDNQGEIKKLLANLERLSGESTDLVKNLRTGIGDPRRLSRLLTNADRATASLAREMDGVLDRTKRALDGVSQVSRLLGPPEKKKIGKLLDRVLALGDRTYALAGDASILMRRLVKGKGTAGAFLAKDELYDDIKEMVRDLKRNPWKFLWRE